MNYALVGYGRMGHAVEVEATRRGHARVERLGGRELGELLGSGGLGRRLSRAEVAFEFTDTSVAERNVLALLDSGVAVVCGTTGWSPTPKLERALSERPCGVVLAPNFSVGMNLFYRLARRAAELYAAANLYQPFVLEAHHRGKRDAPSGTARQLGRILVEAGPQWNETREIDPGGAVSAEVVHVAALRAGYEPGRHIVGFDGEHDVVTLEHRARSRSSFALGAVLAAEWLLGKPGLHDFDAVLDTLLAEGDFPPEPKGRGGQR